MAEEQKKIEQQYKKEDPYEESKIETDTIMYEESNSDDDSDITSMEEPTTLETSPMMIAPATDSTVNQSDTLRNSVLSANALSLEIDQQDPNKKIDEEIKQNLEKNEAMSAIKGMIDETPTKSEQSQIFQQSSFQLEEVVPEVIAPVPVVEEPQTVNEDELIDQDGQFIIFEKEETPEHLGEISDPIAPP